MSKDPCKNLWEKTTLGTVEGKTLAYASLANYYQSKVSASKKQYGEQIGRLDFVLKNLKKAQGKMAGNSNYMGSVLSDAEAVYKSAKRDNDFIYHEIVPSSDTLPAIELVATARLAKLNMELPNTFCSEGVVVDIFSSAVKKKDGDGDGPSLKQIFNTAAGSLGNYLVKLSSKGDK